MKNPREITVSSDAEKGWNKKIRNNTPSTIEKSDELPIPGIVVISCASAVCVVLLIVGAIYLLYRCRKKTRKKMIEKVMMDINPKKKPFNLTALPKQMVDVDDTDEFSPLKINICTDSPQRNIYQLTENRPQPDVIQAQSPFPATPSVFARTSVSSVDESYGDTKTSMKKWHSVESMDKIRPSKRMKVLKRTSSEDNSDSDSNTRPTTLKVDFSLRHHYITDTFVVVLHGLTDLPYRSKSTLVFVTILLMPSKDAEIKKSKFQDFSTSYIRFEDSFTFEQVRKEELDKYTLRISAYCRKKFKSGGKDILIGELFLNCSDVELKANENTRLEKPAPRKRLKRHSTSDKLLTKSLGEILIDLQYQPIANRVKVFIRRAEHLPAPEKLTVVKPVYYVVVKLVKDEVIVFRQTTCGLSGRRIIWNQAFLFDIGHDDINHFSFELDVMREKRRSKDSIVGRVIIGPDSPKAGKEHWNNMIFPRTGDVAKWHNVLPVIAY